MPRDPSITLAREAARREREQIRLAKEHARRAKLNHLENRIEETERLNRELDERLVELRGVLAATLDVNDRIEFDSLRRHDTYTHKPLPIELTHATVPPDRQTYLNKVVPLGVLEKWLKIYGRHNKQTAQAQSQYDQAFAQWQQQDQARQTQLAALQNEATQQESKLLSQVRTHNTYIASLEADYRAGVPHAIVAYNSMVLERSEYPDGFPQNFQLDYASDTLAVDYELPLITSVPAEAEYRYIKTRDAIESKPRKTAEINDLYITIVSAIAVRTFHEVWEADQARHIAHIIFSGYVPIVDPATGRDSHPYLISVKCDRDTFSQFDLRRVDTAACLSHLRAITAPKMDAARGITPLTTGIKNETA